jgi:Uma2 family endonuclease
MGVQTKRWTRAEYERLLRHGVLGEDNHVQLIDGEIIELAPQGPPHATAVGLILRALQGAYGPDYHVRVQLPLVISASSEPEPDLAVIRGGLRDYADHHPSTAALLVEVADTTGNFDRNRKGPIYAEAGISEYWVIDLPARVVDVYRDPARDATGRGCIRSRAN